MTSPSPNAPGPGGIDGGQWMLQAEAAAVAGCSVSVIRKWRRAGAIAERTRTSSGGMKRIEVRLGDVLAKMEDSMPGRVGRASPPVPAVNDPPPSPDPPPTDRLPPAELEVLLRHIAEAERRAATAEAQLQANDVMTALLKERVAALQGQLASVSADGPGQARSPHDLGRLAHEIKEFRKRFEEMERNGVRHDAQHRIAVRITYDAALISLCTAAGIAGRYNLGDSLTPRERTRLASALGDAGLDVIP